MTFADLKRVAEFRNACTVMDAHPVDGDALAGELETMREIFTKSVAPILSLSAGTVLTHDMLTLKKPGTGIPRKCDSAALGEAA